MENETSVQNQTAAGTEPVSGSIHVRAVAASWIKLAFYIHLAAFVTVNLLLGIINAMTTPQYWWVMWPLLGWGFGLLIHALVSFLVPDLFGVGRRMYEKELDRQKGK